MKFQYVFGNPLPSKKRKFKKGKTKNPQRIKAEIGYPSGKIKKEVSATFPEVADVTLVKDYVKQLGRKASLLQKDISQAEKVGDAKTAKAARTALAKISREVGSLNATMSDMEAKVGLGEDYAKKKYADGYATTREVQRGKKWYTESAWEKKLAADKMKADKKKGGKAPKAPKVLNWMAQIPKLSKSLASLERSMDDAEFAHEVAYPMAYQELKKANPSKSKKRSKKVAKKKTSKKSSRKRKSSKKKAMAIPKGYQKIGKKGITKPAIRKIKKKKSKKYYMDTRTKGGKKQRRKFTLKRTNPRRGNPAFANVIAPVVDWTGYQVAEMGSLAMGGLLYGAALKVMNTLIPKVPFVGPVYTKYSKLPVVGQLPTLLLGAAIHKLGQKQRFSVVEQVGQGLVAASLVGIGVSLSTRIPGLSTMSGVELLNGVDYTMGEGPDFGSPDFGQVDFGQGPDFGGIPAGLQGIPEGLQGIPDGLQGVEYTMGEDDGDDMFPDDEPQLGSAAQMG